MATCEMCGEQGALRRTKVEGATLELCEDCQEVGEVIDQPQQPQTSTANTSPSTSSRSRRSSREPDTELVEDFDMRVKQARESRDWSVTDLAEKIKEKDSVIRRVESGKLSPDQRLARKIEGALGITLYEQLETVETSQEERSKPGGQTVGDVAEVRERD